MISKIIEYIALFKLKSLCKKNITEEIRFNSMVGNSKNVLVILPVDNILINDASIIFEYLIEQNKKLFIFSSVEIFDRFKFSNKSTLIDYSQNDISKLKLPNDNLQKRLKLENVDLVLDLNVSEDLFLSYVVNLIPAKFRAGFYKENLEMCYNFSINIEDDINKSYHSMLSSLKMF